MSAKDGWSMDTDAHMHAPPRLLQMKEMDGADAVTLTTVIVKTEGRNVLVCACSALSGGSAVGAL